MYIFMIALGAYFILCQVLIAKRKFPAWLQKGRPMRTVLYGVLAILVSVVIGIGFQLGMLLPALVSIYMGTIITDRYKRAFDQLEKGQSI